MSAGGRPGGWLARLGLTRGAAAAMATIVAVGIAVSLVTPLLALTLSARGVSDRTIGLVVSAYAVAMLVATPFTTRVAARCGTASTMAALTLLAGLLVPLYWAVETVFWLFPLTLAYGGCVSLCFTLSEFWIAAATPPHRRGFVIGLYASLLSIGFAIGPAIIAVFGADGFAPFGIGSAMMLAAALPPVLARRLSPDFHARPRIRFAAFVFAAPVATFGALVFAMGETGGFAFLPLWGAHLGLSPATAALLVSAMTLGNVALQVPLGLLADRMDRRVILLGCAVAGAGGMLLAWLVADRLPALMAVLFLWGGATAGLYSVGLAYLASRFEAGELAGVNAAFVFCYALGMLVGPLSIGEAMTHRPEAGFPATLAAAFALYGAFVLWRIWRNPGKS